MVTTRGSSRRQAALEQAEAASEQSTTEANAPASSGQPQRAPHTPQNAFRTPSPPPAARSPSREDSPAPKISFVDLPNEIVHDVLMRLSSPLSILRMSILCKRMNTYCDVKFWTAYVSKHYQMSVARNATGKGIVVKKLKSMCQECEDCGLEVKICPIVGKLLCGECGQLMTVTRAKKDFKVNDQEIAHLRFVSKSNPHYRSAAPMRLYSVLHIKQVSDAKWAAKNTTLEAKKATPRKDPKIGRNTRLDKALAVHGLTQADDRQICADYIKTGRGAPEMWAKMIADCKQRRETLEGALAQRGLDLRSDSKLCEAYIHGGSLNDPGSIVDTMETMHIAFVHSILHTLREEARQELWEQHDLDNDEHRYTGNWDGYNSRKGLFYEEWEEGGRDACTGDAIDLYEAAIAAGATGSMCACGRSLISNWIERHREEL